MLKVHPCHLPHAKIILTRREGSLPLRAEKETQRVCPPGQRSRPHKDPSCRRKKRLAPGGRGRRWPGALVPGGRGISMVLWQRRWSVPWLEPFHQQLQHRHPSDLALPGAGHMKGPKVSLGRNSFLIRRRAELSTGPSGRSQPRGQRFGHRRLDRRKGTAIARVDPKTDPHVSVLVGDKADIRQKMRRGIGQSSQHSLRLERDDFRLNHILSS